ncbi:hypothetical protein ACFSZS_04945 [Seohaeicola zhoushanensis]
MTAVKSCVFAIVIFLFIGGAIPLCRVWEEYDRCGAAFQAIFAAPQKEFSFR